VPTRAGSCPQEVLSSSPQPPKGPAMLDIKEVRDERMGETALEIPLRGFCWTARC